MPVTIGSQTDVPSPGDPIVSPWYQDTARKIVHTFATNTARDAWVSAPVGAMCYVTATGTLQLKGAAGWTVITASSIPSFRVIGGAGQSFPSGVPTTCTWTTEQSDPWSIITGGVMTVPAGFAGRWSFEWSVNFPAPSTGVRNVWLQDFGANVRYGEVTVPASADSSAIVVAGATSVVLAAGGQVGVQIFHTHSGGLNGNASTNNHFQGRFVSAA